MGERSVAERLAAEFCYQTLADRQRYYPCQACLAKARSYLRPDLLRRVENVLWRNRYRLARLDAAGYRNVADEVVQAVDPPDLPPHSGSHPESGQS